MTTSIQQERPIHHGFPVTHVSDAHASPTVPATRASAPHERSIQPDRSSDGQEPVLARDLARALQLITKAELAPSAAECYLAAHLAAQQVAAVVLASGATRLAAGPSDPWPVVARVAPECGEWAAWFAALQGKRSAVAAGARAIVTRREADDLVRDARGFHDMVARRLERVRRSGVRGGAGSNEAGNGGARTGARGGCHV